MYVALFTTKVGTCFATNQVVGGCEKFKCCRKQREVVLFAANPVHVARFTGPRQTCFAASDVNVFPLSLPLHPFKFYLLLLQFLRNNSIEMRAAQAANQNQPYLLIGHKIVLIYVFTCSVSLSYSTKINLFNAEFTRA